MNATTVGTTLSLKERGDLAERMLPVAGRLASIVRGDGGLQDVQHVIWSLGEQERVALLVVMAGLIDPDAPVSDALRWLEFNENGETIVPELPGWNQGVTLRDLGEELPVDTDPADLDEVAIDRALKGDRTVQLNRAERLRAILSGREQGKTYLEMDELLGYRPGASNQTVLRACRAAEARGEVLEVAPSDSRVLTQQEVVAIREGAAAGATDVELALRHGVSRPAVSRLVAGVTYAQYGGPLRGARSPGEGPVGPALAGRQEAVG
ncbi:hypothetical protein [Streptomyces sp. NPDC087297]|uniref:hypothetical protein n=1 Tax=Streptomyces sp. NPDC087297 TaxID=3365778 RepID=UPI00382C6876